MAKYTPKIGDKICNLTANSSVGLRSICKQLRLPYSTVTDWVYNREHDIYLKYRKAKVQQIYHLSEEILELRNDCSNDYMTVIRNGKSIQVLNRQALARTNLLIGSAMMLITKMRPALEKEIHHVRKTQPYNKPHRQQTSNTKAIPSGAPENALKLATRKDAAEYVACHGEPELALSDSRTGRTMMGVKDTHAATGINHDEQTSNTKAIPSGAPENALKLATRKASAAYVACHGEPELALSNSRMGRTMTGVKGTHAATLINPDEQTSNTKTIPSGAPENALKPATGKQLTLVIARHEATSQHADASNNENLVSTEENNNKTLSSGAPENNLKLKTGKAMRRLVAKRRDADNARINKAR